MWANLSSGAFKRLVKRITFGRVTSNLPVGKDARFKDSSNPEIISFKSKLNAAV